MIFKNLEERFNATVAEIYGKHARDEKFVMVLPNDPNKDATAKDSRESYQPTLDRDFKRVTTFLNSPLGKSFMNRQTKMQQINTFSETRGLRQSFILDNLDPKDRISRNKTSQLDFVIFGSKASPGARGLGKAGRLQKESLDSATSRAFKTSNIRPSISSLFSATVLGELLRQKTYLVGNTLGVDERPELNINGNQLYSVMLWKGSSFEDPIISDIRNVAGRLGIRIPKASELLSNFPIPNYLSAISNSSIVKSVGNLLGGVFGNIDTRLKSAAISTAKTIGVGIINRNGLGSLYEAIISPFQREPHFDQLYFIRDRNEENNVTYLNSRYKFGNAQEPFSINVATTTIGIPAQIALDVGFRPNDADLVTRPDRLLVSRYTVSRVNAIVNSLQSYRTVGKSNIGTLSRDERNEILSRGLVGGLDLSNKDQPSFPSDKTNSVSYSTAIHSLARRQYYVDDAATRIGFLSDKINLVPVGTDDKSIKDFIKFKIYDVENKKTLLLRATIHDLAETIEPAYEDSIHYIGRTEANVVYTSANRMLNFSFYIHAFSAAELNGVWDKINYISGLAFPAKMNEGFMIAPLIRMTIGDVYVNQPGYLTSIVHTFDNNIPWEITEGWQKPHGVKVTVSFKILEKDQMTTGSRFYGEPPKNKIPQTKPEEIKKTLANSTNNLTISSALSKVKT